MIANTTYDAGTLLLFVEPLGYKFLKQRMIIPLLLASERFQSL